MRARCRATWVASGARAGDPHGNHLHPKWSSVPPDHLGHVGPGAGVVGVPRILHGEPVFVKAQLTLEELVGEVGLEAGVVGVPRIPYWDVVLLEVVRFGVVAPEDAEWAAPASTIQQIPMPRFVESWGNGSWSIKVVI